MSVPCEPPSAKLIVGFFLKDKGLAGRVCALLTDAFGPLDLVSPWLFFGFTDYYAAEMGSPLFRRLLAFQTPVPQDRLSEIKLRTNDIEQETAEEGKRRINLDPGLLTAERFVLATGKNYTHRIYLGRGIFADLTLIYHKGGFEPLPWTYPDYGQPEPRLFLERARKKYLADRKSGGDRALQREKTR